MNQEFDDFLAMAFKYDENKDQRVMVFCEECNDITIISSKTGVECGHRPKWLDKLECFHSRAEADK